MKRIQISNDKNKEGLQNKKGLFTPAQILTLGFAGFIALGTILLSLPFATVNGKGLSLLDALFTSTSAVCVTGLVVVDTGTYFTVFGQLVILSLIEIGGLGFMTFATLFAIILGRKITLKERILLQEALNQVSQEGIVRLTKYVLQITFSIQALGAVILTLRWAGEMGWSKAVYYGVFHAVSAFNNAGFDLFGSFSSLTGYTGDIIVNGTVIALIIIGGLGFVVLSELYVHRGKKIHLHSQLVLISSAVLILISFIVVFVVEYTNPQTLANLDPLSKFLASLFQAVTPRTAGFNTLPINNFRDTTLLFFIVMMFIGASPGSTGGGIKTTTFITLAAAVINSFKGKSEITVRERTIPGDIVSKAMTIALTGLLLILTVTALLTITEQADFLTLLFETTSAFGTVGLSLGITPNLTPLGKFAIILTMYTGRLGPMTLAFALAQKRKVSLAHIKYPEERILIG